MITICNIYISVLSGEHFIPSFEEKLGPEFGPLRKTTLNFFPPENMRLDISGRESLIS
jgi:hypothetical protein